MSQGKSVGSNTTEYTLSVKGTFTGFQFLDFGNTKNTVNPAYDRKLSQYTAATPTDVYYILKDGTWAYYLDADGKQLFRICKHQNMFVPSVFTLRNQLDGRRQLLIAGERILRLQW